MPPPPPPSKSYLLVLDSDSEDEDDFYEPQQQQLRPPRVVTPSQNDYSNCKNDNSNDNNNTTRITTTSGDVVKGRDETELVLNKDPSSPPPGMLLSSSSTCTPKEEDEQHEEEDLHRPTKNQKKNKKNKKKRKKKKSKQELVHRDKENDDDDDDVDVDDDDNDDEEERHDDDQQQQQQQQTQQKQRRPRRRRVTFSHVVIRTYPRAFSDDAVPADGGWPLGMSLDKYQDHDQLPLEEYETWKQHDLLERWHRIRSDEERVVTATGPSESPTNSPSPSSREQNKLINAEVIRLMDHSLKGPGSNNGTNGIRNGTNQDVPYLETRQWDYRNGVRNPLFGLLVEEKRQSLFLEASTPPVPVGEDSPLSGEGGKSPTNFFDQQQQQQQQQHNKRRNRSNSVTSQTSSNTTSHPNRRARSNSFGSHNNNGSHQHTSSSNHVNNNNNSNNNGNRHHDQFNETYNQVYVHHVRNELEQLRIERSKSGATGCNCRKLTVYIPPKDGSGGKKAQHRRLKPGKLTQELKKRNLYDPASTREEMERTLHDAVEKEPCCSTDDCFCVRNGIDCQADACSCWHDSHVHTKSRSGDKFPSTEEIKNRCGNPLGMYVVDLEAIDTYRRRLLQTVPPIQWQLPERKGHNSSNNNKMMVWCQQCDPIMV